ncbi:Ger(x)C family spore germination protein [Paenibacillus aestuarii]|uniref:Ger(X)C family spore germination protein n=1 Tax=Paenibacillus aestuarii TaxID=516965 RepID=A0ABW0KHS9_9BACL|nr:Ger(x)C family spore germination protein [Paenibacillus aestuarii]
MKKIGLCLILSSLLLLLGGCWDLNNIENLNFVNAIGMDYANQEYIAYGQMVDYATTAKQENGKSTQPSIVWVGQGRGKTVNLAITNLYQTAQNRIIWSHVGAMVLSERMIQHGFDDMNDANLRYRELRVTPWIYGTHENMDQLFSTQSFFNLSHLSTLLHEPIETYRQRSWIQPMRYLYFISDILEPGKTVALPSVSINKDQWTTNQKATAKLEISGAFIIHNDVYKGWLDNAQLRGLRWMNTRTKRSPIVIRDDGKAIATVSLEKPHVQVNSRSGKDQKPKYSIRVQLIGNIVDLYKPITEKTIQQKTEAAVENELRLTYKESLNIRADVFQLEYYLYKDHYPQWQAQNQQHLLRLDEDSLVDIQVHVDILNTGMTRVGDLSPVHGFTNKE